VRFFRVSGRCSGRWAQATPRPWWSARRCWSRLTCTTWRKPTTTARTRSRSDLRLVRRPRPAAGMRALRPERPAHARCADGPVCGTCYTRPPKLCEVCGRDHLHRGRFRIRHQPGTGTGSAGCPRPGRDRLRRRFLSRRRRPPRPRDAGIDRTYLRRGAHRQGWVCQKRTWRWMARAVGRGLPTRSPGPFPGPARVRHTFRLNARDRRRLRHISHFLPLPGGWCW
jgi:hypothetical protein